MPTLTVVAGATVQAKVPLLALAVKFFQESVVLDPDAIARALQLTGEGGGSHIDARRMVLHMAEELLDANQSFLVETTLSGNTYLRIMARAKAAGYLVVLLYLGTTDVSINIQRIRQRVGGVVTTFRRTISCEGIQEVLQLRKGVCPVR